MLCRELNRGKCKTYLVACERTRKAALIDPVRDKVERYLAMLAYFEHRTQQNDRRAVGHDLASPPVPRIYLAQP